MKQSRCLIPPSWKEEAFSRPTTAAASGRYVDYFDGVGLYSAIGNVVPMAKLEARETQVFAERDRRLEAARRQRQQHRQKA
jgi:hypothetical protein